MTDSKKMKDGERSCLQTLCCILSFGIFFNLCCPVNKRSKSSTKDDSDSLLQLRRSKILVAGDATVGKTSLIECLISGES